MLRAIHVFGLHVPTYACMLFLGVIAFFSLCFLFFKKTRQEDLVSFNRILFVGCLAVLCLGASAFFFNSLFHSIEEGRIVIGGITWLGGVVGVFPSVLLLTHLFVPKMRGRETDVLDGMIPGMALAHAFGRLGCFLGGCCYGKVTDSFLGVVFPVGSLAAKKFPNELGTGSLPVLPTQLFETAFELLLFASLLLFAKRLRGHYTEIYAVFYGFFRFGMEFLRADDRGATGIFLSPAQVLSLLLVLFGVLLFLFKKGKILAKLSLRLGAWREKADALPVRSLDGMRETALLKELYALKEEGAITEEEYEEKKKEILSRL